MQRAVIIFLLLIFSSSQVSQRLEERYRMVDEQIISRGITDDYTIAAMRKVTRHEFVPPEFKSLAYSDRAIPIGYNQTISQPYIVAYMTEALKLQKNNKVLEIGTGSGYQAAILSEIVSEVISIEIVEPLALEARERLKRLKYNNVSIIFGDGYEGYVEKAPYDAIIVTAAPDKIPQTLINQLSDRGRMIIPVGKQHASQHLILIEKTDGEIKKRKLIPVRFVPFTGKSEND